MRRASVFSNFAWSAAGNLVYGAGQWAVVSLIAKLGNREMLGQYALAAAVAAPVIMLSHLNLRAVLATDVKRQHELGDYISVRLKTSLAALAALAAVTVFSGFSALMAAAVLITGFWMSADNVSDLYYGALQRRERMDTIALSMMARGVLSAAALGVALWFTHNLLWAIAALAAGRFVVLLAYDQPRGTAGESIRRTSGRVQFGIFRMALWLGVALLLGSLMSNLPRYAIERYLGTRELGAFAAVGSFVTAGASLVNALGQSATPGLARSFSLGEFARFRLMVFQLAAAALAAGGAGLAGVWWLGKPLLRVLYRPEYEGYSSLLVMVVAAGICTYVAGILGYAVTSTRSFAVQAPLLAAATAVCAAASFSLVPALGLPGAALAIGVAALVQIGGQLLVLRRALDRAEHPA
jgi:O-antigen/teichoic acid export membrane protein